MLDSLFRSEARVEILRMLFTDEKLAMYLREMERQSTVKKTALENELKNLLTHQFITARKDGNRVYYQANPDNPIFAELVAIVDKTIGLRAILRERLQDDRITLAILFGSFAKGTHTPTSDIDLIIVGDIGLRGFSKIFSGVEQRIGREINPHVYSEEVFAHMRQEGDHFLTSVLAEEFEVLKGSL